MLIQIIIVFKSQSMHIIIVVHHYIVVTLYILVLLLLLLFVGAVCYADDIALIAPSASA